MDRVKRFERAPELSHNSLRRMEDAKLGKLIYGSKAYELDDRLLAHLQLVVSIKLRRGENFLVSWRNARDEGSGRQAVWIDNGLHLAFEYSGGAIPTVNRQWVERLALDASSSMGLSLTDENGDLLNDPRPAEV